MAEAAPRFDDVYEPGDLLARRYRLETAIASGGMGTVFRAAHLALGHDVAVKVLHGAAVHDDGLRRFAREAKLSARLGDLSRNIARVVDYGVERGRPYLVMELLRGEDLRERLQREPRLPSALIVEVVTQLCAALEIAHDEGITHRDVKPANIFLARGGSSRAPELVVKLMDFGVASLAGERTLRSGVVLGTPAFMAPEQVIGGALDHRVDLWAVAALVHTMLTGRTPFGNGTLAEIGASIISDPPARTGDLSRAVEAWLARGLAKDPDQRFQSATELAESLAEALAQPHAEDGAASAHKVQQPHRALLPQVSGVRLIGTEATPVARGSSRTRVAIPLAGLVTVAALAALILVLLAWR